MTFESTPVGNYPDDPRNSLDNLHPGNDQKGSLMVNRIVTTRPRNIETIAKVTRALQLRIANRTWDEIAEMVGYSDRAAAYNAVKREMDKRREQAAETAEQLRDIESERLDAMAVAAMEILKTIHYATANGKVVEYDGRILEDDGPRLAAIDRLLRISESRRRLFGLDSATKIEAAVSVAFTVQGIPDNELP
jgi:hypothetical protein